VDFLQHVVGVATLFRRIGLPFDRVGLPFGDRPVDVDRHTVVGQVRQVTVLEIGDFTGVFEEGRYVTRDEIAVRPVADHERAVLPSCHDTVVACCDDADSEAPLEPVHHLLDRLAEVVLQHLLDEVGDDLGIGLAREGVVLEFLLEFEVVLDDAVVDDRDLASAIVVGMRIRIRRLPVGRPAGVPEATTGRRRLWELELIDLAGLLVHGELAVLPKRDARRVVAAIFEVLQPRCHDG